MLIYMSLDWKAALGMEFSIPRKQEHGLAPWKKRCPPQLPKQQKSCVLGTIGTVKTLQGHRGDPPSITSALLFSAPRKG